MCSKNNTIHTFFTNRLTLIGQMYQFKKVTIEPGVKIKYGEYLFADFINVETFDISGLDTSEKVKESGYK